MRKQYHPLPSKNGLLVWDVDRLIRLAADLPVEIVPVATFRELDEVRWFDEETPPTPRRMLEHLRLVLEADLSFPIMLGSDGRVMDGMHRILKTMLTGGTEVVAKRFPVDPEPDHVGVRLSELSY